MRKRWLQILALLILALGIMPILPAAAQSSCTISTRGTVRMRADHSTTAAVVGTMPRNTQLQAVERFVEDLGRNRTRVWYRLVKEEAAPAATAEQVWVGGSVKTKGDCVNIAAAAAPAAPVTDAGAAPAAPAADTSGVTMPQNGSWLWYAGDTVSATCPDLGTVDIPYGVMFPGLGNQFDVTIAASGSGFTVDGDPFTRGDNGTWYGYYADTKTTAQFRVDTPTNILGDLIFNSPDGCTLKVALWGSPR